MKTKNGIELDLKESKYQLVYKKFIFSFSSELYMRKFKTQLIDFVKFEESKIETRYKLKIDLSDYLAVALYKRIEKRGFLVTDLEGKEIINPWYKTILY